MSNLLSYFPPAYFNAIQKSGNFYYLSFIISSDLGFGSNFFFFHFWLIFCPLDPWISIFLRIQIRIKESQNLQILILSTAYQMKKDWFQSILNMRCSSRVLGHHITNLINLFNLIKIPVKKIYLFNTHLYCWKPFHLACWLLVLSGYPALPETIY